MYENKLFYKFILIDKYVIYNGASGKLFYCSSNEIIVVSIPVDKFSDETVELGNI
jgi:hypothetical protein